MSPAGSTLRGLIHAASRALRRDTGIAVIAAVAAVVPLVLVIAWLAGGARWSSPNAGPLILELTALAAALGVAFFALRRWKRGIDEPDVAATAEERLGLPAGSVRGILELGRDVPRGTSPALFQREEASIARHFLGRTPADLSGALGARVRRRRALAVGTLGGMVIVAGTLAFVSPERTRQGWTPLLSPIAHLTPPPLPALSVTPGDTEVLRGADLAVRVSAPGRSAVTLVWRAQGDVLQRHVVAVEGDVGHGVLPRVDAPTTYWVEAPDGATSARFRAVPIDPLLISELSVEVRYPAYLGRAGERFDTEVPPLEVPEGTQLVIRGRATRGLSSALLVGGDGSRVSFRVDQDAFAASWTPAASGVYEWTLSDQAGAGLASAAAPLEIVLEMDAAPQVEITFPGVDTILDASLMQAVVADARDDYGLTAATLVSWRIGANGQREGAVEQPIQLGGTDRALLRTVLDATERDLIPGDTLKYFVRVNDNSPRQQAGVSQTYALRLPSMAELRERVGREADDAVEDTRELTEAARRLAELTRNLERKAAANSSRRQGQAGRGGSPGQNRQGMDFQDAEQARGVLDQQQQMLDNVEEMRQRLEAMERAMQNAGLRDPALQERLQELRELYDQILTPELRQKLEELKQALDKLDPEQVQKALEDLTREQEELQKQLEQSLELMRRAAAEQQMNALSQEAKELATQQEALAQSMKEQPPTPDQVEAQKELEKRAEQLSAAVDELQKKLSELGESKASSQAGEASEDVRAAERDMEKASQNASQQQGQQASQNGEQAAEKLNQAAQTLDLARQAMADAWKENLQESMQQATSEALSLAQRQQDLLERMKQLEQAQQQQQQQGQQQEGQQQGQQQQGQQQGAQQQRGSQQQQGGQQKQQGGQQQQRGGQQQQQGGQQQQQGGQQQGGQQQGQQQGGQQQSGQQGAGQGGQDLQSMRAEQQALQQGLEQLGRNLAETGERSPMMNRDVGSALGRANLSMQETMQGLQQAETQGRMPTQEAGQTVDALNRLALTLLQNAQQIEQQQSGTGMQEALQQLTEIAKQQGALNGQSNSLMPLNLAPRAMGQQMNKLAQQQREIADKLGGMNEMRGGREDVLGQLDELAKEADRLARELDGQRLSPQVLARQERLFHRLLDAGRSLEKDETSEERVAERPGAIDPSQARALDPSLLENGLRFKAPTPEELKNLSPAYRRLILEYFERLNRTSAPDRGGERR